jgi:hypothetical protein
MTRPLVLTTLLLVGISSGVAQECPRVFEVELRGASARFFDQFAFGEDTGLIPGLQSGELTAGGAATEVIIDRRVAEQQTIQVPYTVARFVDGRLVFETRVREVVRTVYRIVQESQTADLPAITGKWRAIDFCTFSWWSFAEVGADGIAVGAGCKSGDTLSGAAVCVGVSGIPTGVYQIANRAEEDPGPMEP